MHSVALANSESKMKLKLKAGFQKCKEHRGWEIVKRGQKTADNFLSVTGEPEMPNSKYIAVSQLTVSHSKYNPKDMAASN